MVLTSSLVAEFKLDFTKILWFNSLAILNKELSIMRNEVSVGLIIGAALLKKKGKITKADLFNVRTSIRKHAPTYYVDFSRDSVYSEIGANCDCFSIEDDEISLNEFYMEHLDRVRSYFYDMLNEEIRSAIDMAFA